MTTFKQQMEGNTVNEEQLQEAMNEAYEGWKCVQDIEYMSIRDIYECAFMHGVEAAERIQEDSQ